MGKIQYTEAVRAAGLSSIFGSNAGGRQRRIVATLQPGGEVTFRMYKTDIVTVYPDSTARLDSGGWHTQSTWEGMQQALAACMDTPYSAPRPSRDRKGYLTMGYSQDPVRYGDGMLLDADLAVLEPGTVLPSSHAKQRERDARVS